MRLCLNKASQQQDGESQVMQPGQGLKQPFVIARQTPEAGRPGETALHHPPAGQQDETLAGLRQLDDFQLQAMLTGGLKSSFDGQTELYVIAMS